MVPMGSSRGLTGASRISFPGEDPHRQETGSEDTELSSHLVVPVANGWYWPAVSENLHAYVSLEIDEHVSLRGCARETDPPGPVATSASNEEFRPG